MSKHKYKKIANKGDIDHKYSSVFRNNKFPLQNNFTASEIGCKIPIGPTI